MRRRRGVDPVAYRLRYLKDERAAALVSQVAAKVGWEPRTGARKRRDANGNLTGQGFAYAVYVHSKFPGLASAWSAWAADVAVNPATGEVSLTRVTVGQDSGLMINPEGVRHQIHGNVIQSTSRVLKEEVTFSDIAVTSRDWGTYPLLTFPELPAIDLVMAQRPDDEPLGVGESASVPSAAAIANAIYDATGVRFREPPFTPDRILAGLREAGLAGAAPVERAPVPLSGPARKAPGWLRPLVAAALGAVGALGVASLPIRGAIAPIARPDPSAYSAETIARGRALAQLGGCIVCHTAEMGAELAGGRPFDTPFRARLRHQHHAGRGDRHWPLVLRGLCARNARGGRAGRAPSLSRFSLHLLRQGERGRPAGPLCFPHGGARGRRAEPRGRSSGRLSDGVR